MNRELLAYGTTLLAWAAVVYKLPALRHSLRDPALRAYWLTLLSLALSLTLLLPPVYLAVGRVAGEPNLARLLGNGLALVASWSVQAFLLHLNFPGERAAGGIRRAGWALVGMLALMAALFTLAPLDEATLDFTRRYGAAPFILEYRLVFLAYLGLALVNVVRLSWRYGELSNGRPALRLGMRLVAAGGVLGLGYAAHEGLFVLAHRLGLPYPVPEAETITQVLIAGAVGLTIVGSTMPSWGPRVGIPALCHWVSRYAAYQRLRPLWLALYRACPEIALLPPRSGLVDALAVRALGFRLSRRVVEIWDGRLALRPYLDARHLEHARALCDRDGFPEAESRAVIEAAGIAAALQARAAGRPAEQPASSPPSPDGLDLDGEAAFLARVGRAFEHSPIVRAVLAHGERVSNPAAAVQVERLVA